MKSYDEMTNDLLRRRDRYVADQKRKRKIALSVTASLCCFCLIALFAMWQGGVFDAAFIKGEGIYAGGNENSRNDVLCGDYWVPGETDGDTPTEESSASITFDDKPTADTANTEDICDVLGSVIIDGVTYIQFNTDVELYTIDACLGAASDYEGTYKTHLKSVAGKLFTTKEDPDILIVKLSNGGTVALRKVKP